MDKDEKVNFECLNEEDIISFKEDTFKIKKFILIIKEIFSQKLEAFLDGHPRNNRGGFFYQNGNGSSLERGIPCKILRSNSAWQNGKIKITVTINFYPHSSSITKSSKNLESVDNQSPLDEIRKMMTENDNYLD